MISILEKGLSTEISQLTDIFDLETFQKEIRFSSNKLSVDDVDGRYSLSGAVDTEQFEFSAACLNNTFDFVLNEDLILNDTFFGESENSMLMTFHKINIGYAYDRERAIKIIKNPRIGNQIMIYVDNRYVQEETEKTGIGMAQDVKLECSLGILFKVNVKQIESLGCIEFDKILINICTNYTNPDASLLRFNSFGESQFYGAYHVNELMTQYTDRLYSDEEVIKRSKNFKAQFDSKVITKQNTQE